MEDRRPAGTGTVAPHKGQWYARLPRAYGRGWLGPFGSEGEAASELALELQRLADKPPDAETVQGWGVQWLDDRKAAGHWRSIERERDRWRLCVEGSRLGRMPLRDVSEVDVRRWLSGLRKQDGGKPGGQTLSNALSMLRSALEAAREAGLRADNPARDVRIPKGARRGGGDKWTWYTPAELGALHRAARRLGPAYGAIHVVFAYSGLRPGELWGLQWRDVDWDREVLRVQRAVTEERGFDLPKGGKTREVQAVPAVLAALRAWWTKHQARGVRSHHGLVWPSRDGGPHAQGYQARWPEVLRLARQDRRGATLEREGVIFYAYRHTCASHLLMGTWAPQWLDGPLRIEEVRDWLGHTTITVTQRYAHLSEEGIRARVRGTRRRRRRSTAGLPDRSHPGESNPRPTVYETEARAREGAARAQFRSPVDHLVDHSPGGQLAREVIGLLGQRAEHWHDVVDACLRSGAPLAREIRAIVVGGGQGAAQEVVAACYLELAREAEAASLASSGG